MNFQLASRLFDLNNVVYRYTDINTGEIVYVGIVTNSSLPTRHKAHEKEDWYKCGYFLCEYTKVNNKSEAEAIESHLISLYKTDQKYNKAKAGWGTNAYLPTEYKWIPLVATYHDVIVEMRGFLDYYSCRNGIGHMAAIRVTSWIEELEYIEKIDEFLKTRGKEAQ